MNTQRLMAQYQQTHDPEVYRAIQDRLTRIERIVNGIDEIISQPYSKTDPDGDEVDDGEKVRWLDEKLMAISRRKGLIKNILEGL